MNSITITIFAAIALSGCATGDPGSYGEALKRTHGLHADKIVSRMGPPTLQYALSDGGSVLQYEEHYEGRSMTLCHPSYPACFTNNNLNASVCVTRLVTDRSGQITGSSWDGDCE